MSVLSFVSLHLLVRFVVALLSSHSFTDRYLHLTSLNNLFPFSFILHSQKDPSSKPSLTTNALFDHAFGSNKHRYVEIPALESDKIESIN